MIIELEQAELPKPKINIRNKSYYSFYSTYKLAQAEMLKEGYRKIITGEK